MNLLRCQWQQLLQTVRRQHQPVRGGFIGADVAAIAGGLCDRAAGLPLQQPTTNGMLVGNAAHTVNATRIQVFLQRTQQACQKVGCGTFRFCGSFALFVASCAVRQKKSK